MGTQIICLTSSGGLPIFTRKKGDCENLSFSAIGSLNGVHIFCKSQGVQLRKTYMENGLIAWMEYEDSIILIGSTKNLSEKVLDLLLELVFNAMVVCIGLNELKNPRNIERLKRDLKICYPIVDELLNQSDSELLNFSDSILCSENREMLTRLQEFSEQLGSPFCCVLIRYKIAVATEAWWDLNIIDRKLLLSVITTVGNNQKDIAVYLPIKSPNIAYRLVSITIINSITICALCGAEPSYYEIDNLAKKIWKNDYDVLALAEECFPRNFPNTIQFDINILGVLVINKQHSKYVMSRNIQQTAGKRGIITGSHRFDILRTFYHQAVDLIDKYIKNDKKTPQDNENDADGAVGGNAYDRTNIISTESYWCSDYHKCHSLIEGDNLILILYISSVPTHTMRLITQKTLNLILSEKNICW